MRGVGVRKGYTFFAEAFDVGTKPSLVDGFNDIIIHEDEYTF